MAKTLTRAALLRPDPTTRVPILAVCDVVGAFGPIFEPDAGNQNDEAWLTNTIYQHSLEFYATDPAFQLATPSTAAGRIERLFAGDRCLVTGCLAVVKNSP
jgi:hypothetical protein